MRSSPDVPFKALVSTMKAIAENCSITAERTRQHVEFGSCSFFVPCLSDKFRSLVCAAQSVAIEASGAMYSPEWLSFVFDADVEDLSLTATKAAGLKFFNYSVSPLISYLECF